MSSTYIAFEKIARTNILHISCSPFFLLGSCLVMSDLQMYTVGWICASLTDHAAAKALLDKEHPIFERPASRDNNIYTLGEVAKHNVVITALPDGKHGLSETACLGRDMMHTFPNIKIGLSVGVAGGVPGPRKDIRFGDVVVGTEVYRSVSV